MIAPGNNVRVYLACGVTDMRKGIEGLMTIVQSPLHQKPASGSVFAFRGRRGDRIKLLYWDGQGFCHYYKILEKRRVPWPSAKSPSCTAIRSDNPAAAMLRRASSTCSGSRSIVSTVAFGDPNDRQHDE